MAVGFSTSATAGGTASSISLTVPSLASVGNTVVVAITTGSATTMAPGGTTVWTQIGSTQTWAGGTQSFGLFYRRLTGVGDGPGTSGGTITFGASTTYNRHSIAYVGVDAGSPIEDFAFDNEVDASDDSLPIPALATNSASRLVAFGAVQTQTAANPTGFIQRTQNSNAGLLYGWDRGPDYAAGTLGPWSSSLSGASQHAAWSIALKEDPARHEPAWEATGANVTSTSGATSLTPSAPTSIQNDDLMLLELLISSSSATVNSVPSGWTLVDSTFSGQARLYTYRKYYDGSIGSFGFDATVVVRAANSRFTSPHSSAPVDSHTENSGAAGTTVTFPAVTPVGDGLLAYVGGSASAASQTNAANTPTNATERYDAATASASGSVHTFGGTNGNVSAGIATSTFTSTLTNSADWAAQTIVLANPDVTPPAAPIGLIAEAIGV